MNRVREASVAAPDGALAGEAAGRRINQMDRSDLRCDLGLYT